jgi:micrococcal nuclease
MAVRRRRVRNPSAATLLVVLSLALLIAARLLRQGGPAPGEFVRQQQPVVVERVVDGDTLLLAGGQRVRLIGIDTPETKRPDLPVDPLGVEATAFVQSLIADAPVRLEFDRERLDQYERLLAYVWLPDGRLLNEEIIRAGFSTAQTRYPYRQDMKRRFLEAEEEARAAGVGRWRTPSQAAQ